MENQNDLIRQCELKAQQWLDSPVYDDVTKKAVRERKRTAFLIAKRQVSPNYGKEKYGQQVCHFNFSIP